jgi:subtilase family serine protease
MRPSSSPSLALPQPSKLNLGILMLSIVILSTLSFAAAPDRIVAPIIAGQTVPLAAGVPHKAQPEFDQGAVDPSLKLSYMTLLTVPTPSQQKALERLLAEQQDPRSPLYHKWLTPEQYAGRFGLTANDTRKITDWLQAQGFTIRNVARGRNFVVFSGTAAQVESAFQTKIHNFNVDGEMHFANATPASIPAALSGIVTAIRGLNNFRMRPHHRRLKPDYTTASNNLFLAPGDITTMYDLAPLYTAGIDGTGQTLAVMGETDVYLADLVDFRSGFGLSAITGCTTNSHLVITACNAANFQYLLVGDDPTGLPNSIQDDLAEANIDIEWSGAVAKNAQIIYVNAPDPSGAGVYDSLYHAIDNIISPVITISYGLCERDEIGFFAVDENESKKANSEGITILNSSGDSGAAECDYTSSPATQGYSVSYPASSPEVTGVGGTMIPASEFTSQYWGSSNGGDGGSAKSYIPELGWNDPQEWGVFCAAAPSNCNGAPFSDWLSAQNFFGILVGGGGVSNCTVVNGSGTCQNGFTQPAYQNGLSISGQAAGRFSPDVSLLSSIYWPGFIVCTPQSEIGGTGSASSCANGIPNAVVCNGGSTLCSVFGGTSVASPMFAGIVTLLNQYLDGTGSQGLGNINPTLYSLAATPANGAFHQITTGSNGAWCTPGTPTSQPVELRCPSTGPNAGFLGFDASNFDSATSYNLVTGLGSVDANNLAIAWAAARTATTITVQAAPAQALLGDSVTLTATMAPSSSTGQVTFSTTNNSSTTTLGTATLSNGVAVLSTTNLPLGTNHIGAAYSGDGYNMPSTAAVEPVVTITAPTFTWAASGGTTGTVLSGQAAGYSFTATPSGATMFGAAVTFSCSGLPDATVACNFSPASIAAGAGATPVNLTITTSGPNTGCQTCARRVADNRSPWLPLALPLAGIVMVGFAGRKISKHSAVAGLCVSLTLLALLIACGGSSAPPVTVAVSQGSPSSVFPNNNGWPAQTAQFTATVTNTTNTAVTWSVTTPNAGTIDANGLYTAPTVAAGLPATVAIKATSAADPTKSGAGQETLKAATLPGTYNITVTATESVTSHSVPVTLTVQ